MESSSVTHTQLVDQSNIDSMVMAGAGTHRPDLAGMWYVVLNGQSMTMPAFTAHHLQCMDPVEKPTRNGQRAASFRWLIVLFFARRASQCDRQATGRRRHVAVVNSRSN